GRRRARPPGGRDGRIARLEPLDLFELRHLRSDGDEQIDGDVRTIEAQKIEADHAAEAVRDDDQRLAGLSRGRLPNRVQDDLKDLAGVRAVAARVEVDEHVAEEPAQDAVQRPPLPGEELRGGEVTR